MLINRLESGIKQRRGVFIMKMNHHKNGVENVSCAVITVSDTRTTETDKSGKRITEMLTEAGHLVNLYQIIPDEKEQIRLNIKKTIDRKSVVQGKSGEIDGQRIK